MGIQPHDSEPFIPTALPTCPQWCGGGHGREDCGADADGLHHFGEGAGFWLYDIVNTALGTRIMRAGGYEVDLCLQQVDQWSGGNRVPSSSTSAAPCFALTTTAPSIAGT